MRSAAAAKGRTRTAMRRSRELLAWLLLLLFAAGTHLAALGHRVLSHDESIHALSSFHLWHDGEYRHDPTYHGPLLYALDAAAFALLGDDDGTARLVPALAGILLLPLLFAARRELGKNGALAAACLVVVSPTLLFYSRYLVADLHVALLGLAWLLAAARYRETGRRRWLVVLTAAMALALATKEVAFLLGATLGAFFLAASLWPARSGEARTGRERARDLTVWMLAFALPFASPVLALLGGWRPNSDAPPPTGADQREAVLVATAIALALAALRFVRRGSARGRPRFRLWLACAVGFWTLQVALFSGFFAHPLEGATSGFFGSVGYWLGQQKVARGGQPVGYYALLAIVYEPLALVLSTLGLLASVRMAWRRRRREATLSGPRRRFGLLLAAWCGASWVLYSAAGERMPWLFVHVALPMAVLGGWWAGPRVGRVLSALRRGWEAPVLVSAPGLAAIALVSALVTPRAATGTDRATYELRLAWAALLTAGLAALAVRAGRRLGRRTARRLLVGGCVALLALFTLRTALRASFLDEDLPVELLVYAHGTPDVRRAMLEIETIAARTGAGLELEVAYDDEVSWPFAWYLRRFTRQRLLVDPGSVDADLPVVMVGPDAFGAAEGRLAATHVVRDYRLIWWPLEGYHGLTWRRLAHWLTDPAERIWLARAWLDREYAGVSLPRWPNRREFRLYVARDLAARVWPLASERLVEARQRVESTPAPRTWTCVAQEVFHGPFAGAPLAAPAGLALAPDGTLWIADSGNHRVVGLAPDGSARALGGPCEIARGAENCPDDDGAGPHAPGDGRFWQPWDVAVDGEALVVADTWNGRIQIFDPRGDWRRSWGRSVFSAQDREDEASLYGPRGVALAAGSGPIVVSDTGDKRLVLLGRDGGAWRALGGAGSSPGHFAEPIGVAVSPVDGSILVADSWNRRIQRGSADGTVWQTWPVPGWRARGPATTPFLAAAPDGRVFASDPEAGTVLVFEAGVATGALRGRTPDGSSLRTPVGVAVGPGPLLWVGDAATGTIWKIELAAAGASPPCPGGR